MAKETIFVIEDEEDILEIVHYNLSKEGYVVCDFSNGEDGLKAVKAKVPDLVLLDLMLPGMDGLEVCRRLKADAETSKVPIIMLTAKREESDVVLGLEMGADDYISKPFSTKVLVARVRAVFRRKRAQNATEQSVLKVRDLVIHPGRNEVLFKSRPVGMLTATEFRVLHFLARKPGWVFTRQQIINAGRGENCMVTDRAVDVQIVGLRKKLGEAGEFIETVRGIGYRFKE
jgi:two-component system phosphate regulon response regulator PhoB